MNTLIWFKARYADHQRWLKPNFIQAPFLLLFWMYHCHFTYCLRTPVSTTTASLESLHLSCTLHSFIYYIVRTRDHTSGSVLFTPSSDTTRRSSGKQDPWQEWWRCVCHVRPDLVPRASFFSVMRRPERWDIQNHELLCMTRHQEWDIQKDETPRMMSYLVRMMRRPEWWAI